MRITVKQLAYLALYLALFTVLDYLANIIPIFKMPFGGTLGLGTVALLLAAYQLDWQLALLLSTAAVFMQFLTGQMYIYHPLQFLLDYGIAFPVYGLAACFPKYSGIVLTNAIRFLCHFVSGIVFFAAYAGEEGAVLYSLSYNLGYMLPTMLLGLVLVPLVDRRLKTNRARNCG